MYIGYYNDSAYKLIEWSFTELRDGNKIKAIKIERIADKIEIHFRKKNHIPLVDNWFYKPYVNECRYAKITRCLYDKVFGLIPVETK